MDTRERERRREAAFVLSFVHCSAKTARELQLRRDLTAGVIGNYS
jgi:hypothetical protein